MPGILIMFIIWGIIVNLLSDKKKYNNNLKRDVQLISYHQITKKKKFFLLFYFFPTQKYHKLMVKWENSLWNLFVPSKFICIDSLMLDRQKRFGFYVTICDLVLLIIHTKETPYRKIL